MGLHLNHVPHIRVSVNVQYTIPVNECMSYLTLYNIIYRYCKLFDTHIMIRQCKLSTIYNSLRTLSKNYDHFRYVHVLRFGRYRTENVRGIAIMEKTRQRCTEVKVHDLITTDQPP